VSANDGGVCIKSAIRPSRKIQPSAEAQNPLRLNSCPPGSIPGGAIKETEMEKTRDYSGLCFCGAVQFSVSGEPAAMGYCHCDSCRRWSAAP
jgi:hypothetical protein